jgi:hypothetical protein
MDSLNTKFFYSQNTPAVQRNDPALLQESKLLPIIVDY